METLDNSYFDASRRNAGHQEIQIELPEPLQATGFWNVGTWALPATMLSWASVFVFVVVLGFVQRNETMRRGFQLPFSLGTGRAIAVITLLLAWAIVVRSKQRPGRHWPRYWALILAGLTTTVALASFMEPPPLSPALLHALLLAGFAATLVLLLRLLRIRPDSRWIQWIAPSSLAIILVILPLTFNLGRETTEVKERYVQAWINNLRGAVGKLRDLPADFKSAQAACVQAKQILMTADNDQNLQSTAGELGQQSELNQAKSELFDAVTDCLYRKLAQSLRAITPYAWSDLVKNPKGAKQQINKLSELDSKALDDPDFKQTARGLGKEADWVKAYNELESTVTALPRPRLADTRLRPLAAGPTLNPEFANASRLLGDYYSQMARLFIELGKKAELDTYAGEMQKSWSESWLASHLSSGYQQPSLEAMLRTTPVIGALTATNLKPLFKLPLNTAKEQSPDCSKVDEPKSKSTYLACPSYLPNAAGGADLWIEFRLAYKNSFEKPEGIYFILPVPLNIKAEEFKQQIETVFRGVFGDNNSQFKIENFSGSRRQYVYITRRQSGGQR